MKVREWLDMSTANMVCILRYIPKENGYGIITLFEGIQDEVPDNSPFLDEEIVDWDVRLSPGETWAEELPMLLLYV